MFFKVTDRLLPTKNTDTLATGQQAEARAEQFLQSQGWRTRTKNYRCKLGEIDLIMQQNDQLIFVEVRLRSHKQFANAAESVTIAKQKKIVKTAQRYLQEYRLSERIYCRFDVIAFNSRDSDPEWIQNAFSLI
jgi:putative endonuclease